MIGERQHKGLQIAALTKVSQNNGVWLVPSQSGAGSYQVNPQKGYCSCPDHETRQVRCKHLYAVEFTMKREYNVDGTVTDTIKGVVAETAEVQVTYPQHWAAYNAAQVEEKTRFIALLSDLCQNVPQPVQSNGRPRLPMSDMVLVTSHRVV